MNLLQANTISKRYRGNSRAAVDAASFGVAEGEILALVGESGSGKTTLLRILAGLETPDSGDIQLDERVISAPGTILPPERRGIGMVFQHHALFPHLTVERNIAFGIRRLPRKDRAERIASLLDLIGLPDFARRYPHELSGGERQRIALARALAPRPRLLLLDEPFSSLDARLRQSVRDDTRAVLKQHGTTAIFVTHDTDDALAVADKITVIREGVVQQSGAPPEIYRAPANAYVASFFGICNFIPLCPLMPGGPWKRHHIGPHEGDRGLWIRPKDMHLVPAGRAPAQTLTGVIRRVSFLGMAFEVTLECDVPEHGVFHVIVHHGSNEPLNVGERVGILPRDAES
ncbi:ABC transporter ATP-binding protein [Luteolibacter flavescens]|uniref:ABC transporter ATP-binding protein n=1 Tax=Luteolibacter flavescens TaxID=1859460 RepID=A0ABT3FVX8_9BACT|nr:ABC transporter ATP-binding protein [Luteolibacter flavescens]MCW1887557.1 ABC transporter ATP-binding protein [Luteolibacter flavescens]